jgi:phosphoglycerol transferase MdoB-like AlkP superfamily enzyme
VLAIGFLHNLKARQNKKIRSDLCVYIRHIYLIDEASMIVKLKKIYLAEYLQDIKFEIQISLIYFVSMILLFSLFRLLFCIVYADAFAGLSFWDKAISFVYGLRFDISSISIFLGCFIIILFFPFFKKQYFIKICVAMMCISMLTMLLALSVDFFYFPEVKRHMTEDLLLAFRDKDFIIKYALRYYWWALGLIFILTGFAIAKSFKSINKHYNPKPTKLYKSVGVFIVVVLMIVLGRRENFSGMPLNLIDAYNIPKKSENIQLILNGVFTQFYYLKGTNDTKGTISNNYSTKQALKKAQQILLSNNEFFPEEDKYPLMRQIKIVKKRPKYNIIVILLESWTPKYIDSFNGNKGYGVTPNFDNIARNGVKFINAYSAGPRSQYGLIASLVGMQIVPGTAYYYGFDMMNKLTKMALAFNKMGYFTMYTQSCERNAIGMCNNTATNMLNFSESYGKEDFPRLMDYQSDNVGYDYDMLDFVSKKAGQHHKKDQPFFIYSFTGTTHTPFNPTTNKFDKYPRTSVENKYLNSLYYADYSIGHLMDMAKKEGWFDDTIFIFMADHVCGSFVTGTTKERFNIPFVIYAPKIFKPQKIDYVVSQADLIPTIYHLMGIEEPFTAVGTNMFDKDANHFALICDGPNIVFVEGEHYISNNRVNVVESSLSKDDEKYALMNDTLLSLDKAITESIEYNRWYKDAD